MIATVATAATIATAREQRYAAFCCVVSNGYSVWQAGARLAIKLEALSQLINDLRQAPSRVLNTPAFCLVGSLHLHGLVCSKIWASSSLSPSYVEHVVFLDLRSLSSTYPCCRTWRPPAHVLDSIATDLSALELAFFNAVFGGLDPIAEQLFVLQTLFVDGKHQCSFATSSK